MTDSCTSSAKKLAVASVRPSTVKKEKSRKQPSSFVRSLSPSLPHSTKERTQSAVTKAARAHRGPPLRRPLSCPSRDAELCKNNGAKFQEWSETPMVDGRPMNMALHTAVHVKKMYHFLPRLFTVFYHR